MKAVRTILFCLALGPLCARAADDTASAPVLVAANGEANSAAASAPSGAPSSFGVRSLDADAAQAPLPTVRPSLSPLLSFRPPTAAVLAVPPPAVTVPVQVLPTVAPAPAPVPAPAPSADDAAALIPAPSAPPGDKNYTIHAGDTLEVALAGEAEFDVKAVVQNSGAVTLPYAREVVVAGMTIPQANAAISKRLAEFYVNPMVSVDVVQFRKKEFIILGQVTSPGVYAFSSDQDSMSLVEAIAKAGGVKQYGDLGHVTVKRIVDGKEQVIAVNAREAKALSRGQDAGMTFPILPGDSIVISLFRNEINLLGEVRRPGIYTLPPLLDSIDLIEAVAMAGGTTDGRDLGVVHVKRAVDGKVLTLNVDAKDIGRNKADASFPVYAGDTLIVEVVDNEFIVLGQVNHPGSYQVPPFHDSIDLIEAIAMAGGATRLADTSHVTIRRTVNGKTTVIKANAQKLARSASEDHVDVLPGDRIVISERIF